MIEGQATVVECDYLLRGMQLDVSLATSAQARQVAASYLQASYYPPVVVHNAPRLLRETLIFPYREGMNFELELLSRGGQQMAFRGAFKHPPVDTHQILQPDSYLANERVPQLHIPDLSKVLGDAYVPYDSGSLGEFDVQLMAEEYGRENDIYTVARKWDGGAYVAVRRAGLPASSRTTTGDLALVYVSRWKTSQAAERMGKIYLQALAKRLPVGVVSTNRCDEAPCHGALWEQHAQSSEGPVNIELWPGNLLLITHSIDSAHMQALRPLLLAPDTSTRAALELPELAPRLLDSPQMQALSEQLGREIVAAILKQIQIQ